MSAKRFKLCHNLLRYARNNVNLNAYCNYRRLCSKQACFYVCKTLTQSRLTKAGLFIISFCTFRTGVRSTCRECARIGVSSTSKLDQLVYLWLLWRNVLYRRWRTWYAWWQKQGSTNNKICYVSDKKKSQKNHEVLTQADQFLSLF